MNKPVPAFNWVLDTDKAMSKVVFIDLLSTEKFVVEKIPDVEKLLLPFYRIGKV